MFRFLLWLAVLGGAAAIAWFGFLRPRPLGGYSDEHLAQLENAQTKEIADAYAEAEKKGIALGTGGVIASKDLADAARIQGTIAEASGVRREIWLDQEVRRWRGPGLAAVGGGALLGVFSGAWVARRRRKQAEAPMPPGGVRYQAANNEESAARQLLGLGAFATAEEVEVAFRNQIAQYHPDKVSHLGKDLQELAKQKSRDLVKARDTLRRLLQASQGEKRS